jgi:hypothetical protein
MTYFDLDADVLDTPYGPAAIATRLPLDPGDVVAHLGVALLIVADVSDSDDKCFTYVVRPYTWSDRIKRFFRAKSKRPTDG